jgi:propionyl-CoA carboxylase beta chain
MGSKGAQKLYLKKKLMKLIQHEIARKEAEYADLFANPYTQPNVAFIDEVILPQNTRRKLIKALACSKIRVHHSQ